MSRTKRSKKSKQAAAREFDENTRMEIVCRDRGNCIFCNVNYHMERATWFGREIKSIMHYIPRAQNGLGCKENGAVGCQYHHEMMDNGNEGRRDEMLGMFKQYLQSKYPEWDESKLVYSKWSF